MTREADSSESTRSRDAAGNEREVDSVLGILFQIKDHLEMVIVAFIMALVIRCFLVEVFKIPTGSMEPTLMGNHKSRPYGGDRIMVNKFYYLFHPVKRFDVVVFRYPLNVMRNFIKRAVGVGPEYIRMRRGDIYHSRKKEGPFKIARKDMETQQSIWISLPPTFDIPGGADILDHWQLLSSGGMSENPEFIRLRAGDKSPASLIFHKPLEDAPVIPEGGIGKGHGVKDLKIETTFSGIDPGEEMDLFLFDGPWKFQLHVGDKRKPGLEKIHREEDRRESFPVEELAEVFDGEKHRLEYFLYDGLFCVILDGEVVLKESYRSRYKDFGGSGRMGVDEPRIRVNNGTVRIHTLGLYRDIYYWWGEPASSNFHKNDEPVKIPKGNIMVIGDNVNESRDSRKWKQTVVTLENGKTYYFDTANIEKAQEENRKYVKDRNGLLVEMPANLDVKKQKEDIPFRFIRKELLVGKALWVWWPYTRWKVIR